MKVPDDPHHILEVATFFGEGEVTVMDYVAPVLRYDARPGSGSVGVRVAGVVGVSYVGVG